MNGLLAFVSAGVLAYVVTGDWIATCAAAVLAGALAPYDKTY
jgi:hypothetical protein